MKLRKLRVHLKSLASSCGSPEERCCVYVRVTSRPSPVDRDRAAQLTLYEEALQSGSGFGICKIDVMIFAKRSLDPKALLTLTCVEYS